MLKKRNQGFALLLVSLMIVIMGFITINAITEHTAKSRLDKNQVTREKMQRINERITEFAATHGRLPCPASPTDVVGSNTFGFESRDSSYQCNATNILASTAVTDLYSGAAPVRTLGLPDDDMVDGWGNKIEYIPSPGLFIGINENYSGPNYINSGGALSTINAIDGSVVDNQIGYVLISRGEDGYAAYNAYSGNQNPYPPSSLPIEQQNAGCTPGGSCGPAEFNGKFSISSGSNTPSDDIIIARNYPEFTNSCFLVTNSKNCLQNQCVNTAAPVNWQNNIRTINDKEEVLVISSNNPLPILDLTQYQLNATGSFLITFKINKLITSNATIGLSYQYKNQGDPTIYTSNITSFSASDIGKTISNFTGGGTIYQNLQFTITPTGANPYAYMEVSNINISDYNTSTTNGAKGNLLYELWNNISGTKLLSGFQNTNFINNLPNSRHTLQHTDIGTPSTTYFFDRLYGYITPPTTGDYTFYVSSDDDGTFWFSESSTSPFLTRMAYIYGYSTSPYTYTNYSYQKSAAVSLNAGQSYYFGAWHHQGPGTSNFSIAWTGPGISSPTVIDQQYISTIPPKYLTSPPICKAFYTTKATLTPATNPQPADVISLNNTYGRYVKLSLLSSQPTGSGDDPRQDVYFIAEVKFVTTSGAFIDPGILTWSSDLYVDNSNVFNYRPYQAIGNTGAAITSTSHQFGAVGDFISNGQYIDAEWVTQNTRSPQYVIFDLGTSMQLDSIAIWNGNQLYTETTPSGCSAAPTCSSQQACSGGTSPNNTSPGICGTDANGCPIWADCNNYCPVGSQPTQCLGQNTYYYCYCISCTPLSTYCNYCSTDYNSTGTCSGGPCQWSIIGYDGSYDHYAMPALCTDQPTNTTGGYQCYVLSNCSGQCPSYQCYTPKTCCPGRAVKDVQISVSDDPYYLIYNTP